jgi:aspartokinase
LETIAVYKEERVKVYGITEKTGLALVIIGFPASRIEQWGQLIVLMENHMERFELVTYHATNKSMTELHLVLDPKKVVPLNDMLKKWAGTNRQVEFRLKQPVDLLYLHGPHFQDRFGIADIAFNALLRNDIEILISGCAGTSMYLVTPANQGQDSRKILAETFLIPTSV